MEAINLLQVRMMQKKLNFFSETSHPPLDCNEDEFEGFGLWKEKV